MDQKPAFSLQDPWLRVTHLETSVKKVALGNEAAGWHTFEHYHFLRIQDLNPQVNPKAVDDHKRISEIIITVPIQKGGVRVFLYFQKVTSFTMSKVKDSEPAWQVTKRKYCIKENKGSFRLSC